MINISKKKIWVAGHNGMVGSAIVRKLVKEGCNVIKASKKELNLVNQQETNSWIKNKKPEIIILAAAKVGGIKFNMLNKTDFLYENLNMKQYNHGRVRKQRMDCVTSNCGYTFVGGKWNAKKHDPPQSISRRYGK